MKRSLPTILLLGILTAFALAMSAGNAVAESAPMEIAAIEKRGHRDFRWEVTNTDNPLAIPKEKRRYNRRHRLLQRNSDY